jgi:hypothetical protein
MRRISSLPYCTQFSVLAAPDPERTGEAQAECSWPSTRGNSKKQGLAAKTVNSSRPEEAPG